MSRGLGAALTLSVLAHGGAVATVGVLGVAWVTRSPLTPRPAALYVDLVRPVVATSDRHETTDASALRPRIARLRTPVAVVTRVPFDVAASTDTPVGAAVAPAVTPSRGASAAPDVPRPPAVPASPQPIDAPAESTPPLAPTIQRPSSTRFAPTETMTRGPASDTGTSAPRRLGPEPVLPAPSSDLVDGRQAPPASAMTSARASHGPGTGEPAETGTRGRSKQGGAAEPGAGGQPAAAGGASLARLPPGEDQGGSAPDGAIPLEYESYLRSLRQRVQERLAYPWTAVRRGQQGVVELEVRVGADGRLVAVEVVAGVDADTLRTAAVAAVRGSAPFPFPPEVAARPLVIRLPVEFRLR